MKFKDFFLLTFLVNYCWCYTIFEENVDFIYNLHASVELIPDVSAKDAETVTQWSLNGSLRIQRIDNDNVAMQLNLDRNDEELKPLTKPFILKSLAESPIYLKQHPKKAIELPENEPIWSGNIKRGIAALFQVEGSATNGAFVSNEFGLNGLCPTEYYVVNSSDVISISKIYDMDRCSIPGGIFEIRSNIPINICEIEKNKAMHAVTSRLGEYKLMKLTNSKYSLRSIHAESKSNVQVSESYYPQFIFTKVFINLISENELVDKNRIQFNESESMMQSDFTYVRPVQEATGGRAAKTHDQIIDTVINMLTDLAENLENKKLNFDEPYMEIISEILRLSETMNFDALKKLYDQIDIGTSYIQETSRNIFLEILPRVGTTSSVLLTKYLIIKKHVRSTTAVQLLTALPFFITEVSYDLVKECEEFLHIGIDRPDVKHSAVLSYSTMIYKAYVAGALSSEQFEKYVKMIFDLFLNSFDYEQQMLYLEAMGNLQLGNVPNYLQPIIQADYSQTTDIRFLAIFATLPTAYSRSTEVFETYWPIFYTKTTPLQLRIAAFQMLLVSAQTSSGRLLGLFNVIKNENCPHMINFYRTTVLSISESTNSCLAHLKRLVLYMRRHLPPAPPKKYWITGNYIFDYKDRKFQIGSMVQVMLIGDRRRDLPLIVFLKFDTEAMGRFTGQLGVYIKARGLSDAILDRIYSMDLENMKFEELSNILKIMKMQPIQSTPLHLEFIVQFEGKTILSYYLNQTTFYNLTDGDIINRINAILRTDSHINMQLIRRPFVIKHGFSTLIGTPAHILIESTMIASIRGSTTQSIDKDQLIRNNQVDLRYSTYAVSKILSYNPLDDIEFSTIREQGFLVYLPINNEIKLNLLEQFVSFSFYRKEPITSGLSLKSRTRSFSGTNEIAKKTNDLPVFKFNLEDIGINVLIGHNVESSKENLMFLFESDVHTSAKVFTRTPYSIVQNILTLVSFIQLISIHISRDKHLTVLLANEPKSKVEIGFKYKTEDLATKEGNVVTIESNLLHILDYDSIHSKQLHKWEFSTKFTTVKNSKANKAFVSFIRKTKNGEKWKLCITSSLDRLIHFKKPFKFTSNIAFGVHDDALQYCPNDKSKINFSMTIGSPAIANEKYEGLNIENTDKCTKEIAKFLPIAQFSECKTDDLEKVLSINDLKMDVDFEEMPSKFYDVASRIDHIISAFMPDMIPALNLSKNINVEVKFPSNEIEETLVTINENRVSIPFNCHLKYGDWEQSLVDYSFSSVCSLYKDNLNTLNDDDMLLTENIRKSNSYNQNEMLLFAECAEIPRLAILVEYKSDSNNFSQIKINAGNSFVIIKGDRKPVIIHDGKEYDLTSTSFEYPPLEKYIRISINEDSIVEIENDLMNAKIQYNMENLISISIPTIMKGKICGLCNVHKNKFC